MVVTACKWREEPLVTTDAGLVVCPHCDTPCRYGILCQRCAVMRAKRTDGEPGPAQHQ